MKSHIILSNANKAPWLINFSRLLIPIFIGICPVLISRCDSSIENQSESPAGESRNVLIKCSDYVSSFSEDEEEALEIDVPAHLMWNGKPGNFRLNKPNEDCPENASWNCNDPWIFCPGGNIVNLTLPLELMSQHPPEEDSLLDYEYKFYQNGILRISDEYFEYRDYCVQRFNNSGQKMDLRICSPECGKSHLCIPKCCTLDRAFQIDILNNVIICKQTKHNDLWKPLVHKSSEICEETQSVHVNWHFLQFTGPVDCPSGDFNKYTLKAFPTTQIDRIRFRVLENGSVIVQELQSSEWVMLPVGSYCLDAVETLENNSRLEQILLVCSDVNIWSHLHSHNSPGNQTVALTGTGIAYIVLLFSGTPFLLLTTLVFILLWDKQNVHGWTLFSHSLSMLCNYLGQGVTNALGRVLQSDGTISLVCLVTGIANHYFFLSSFCWLTMINLDLWSTFRHLTNTLTKSRGVRRFVCYSIFAWGLPGVVVMIGVFLDWKFGVFSDDGNSGCGTRVIVPLYGHPKHCLIAEEAISYYVYYPIGILLICNSLFVVLTLLNMYEHKKTTRTATSQSTSNNNNQFKVFGKLLVVMGIVWMLEVPVWGLKKKQETLPFYLVYPDFLNALQALAVFIVFTCQPKVINQLRQKYGRLTPILEIINRLPCLSKPQSREPDSIVMKSTSKMMGEAGAAAKL